MLRITFPESKQAWILTDLKHVLHWDTVWSHVRVEDNSTVTGFHLEHGWAKERYLYFAARYSRPFDKYQIISDGKPVMYGGNRFRSRSEIEGGAVRFQSRAEAAGANLRFLAEYSTKKDEVILVKIAVSAVSAENALKNLDADLPHWDFDRVRNETRKKWDRELSKIQIEGTQEEKETFYTAMYHAFTTPNLYQDVTGEYRGLDHNIHKAEGFTNYAIFSLWDTFRAAHPLYRLDPSRARRRHDQLDAGPLRPEHRSPAADLVVAGERNVVHDRLSRGAGHRRCLFQRRQGLRRRTGLQGDQDHGHESRLRQPARLRPLGLGALRLGKRIGLENARIRLRRLVHRADGQSAGKNGRLRAFHAPGGQL